jgi:ABC-type phosphate transport system substrate-binding protein
MTRREILSFALTASCVKLMAVEKAGNLPVVIVHPSNRFDSLSRSKVESLFLRRVSRWPWGAEVVPVELANPSRLREAFLAEVLRTTEEQLQAYWIDQRATRGVSPPLQAPDVAAVKAIVAARPGAIGYIPAGALDGSVKELRLES